MRAPNILVAAGALAAELGCIGIFVVSILLCGFALDGRLHVRITPQTIAGR